MGIATGSRGLLLLLVISLVGHSQTNCSHGGRLEGDVVDPTGAVIPGARVSWSQGGTVVSYPAGHYLLACVMEGTGEIKVEAPNFARLTKQIRVRAGTIQRQNLTLD